MNSIMRTACFVDFIRLLLSIVNFLRAVIFTPTLNCPIDKVISVNELHTTKITTVPTQHSCWIKRGDWGSEGGGSHLNVKSD